MAKTRVLIVDDSAVIRQYVKEVLERDPEIEVVAVASDARFAEKRLEQCKPDVITLDIEMPGVDGLAFLQKLMNVNPMPVVMLSAHTDRHAVVTIRALEFGAVDFITKPKSDVARGINALEDELITKVKAAATANIRSRRPRLGASPEHSIDEVIHRDGTGSGLGGESVVVVGASTGGTVAISDFLSLMPKDSPGVVVVQHMPANFTRAYAERIDELVDIAVWEAGDGDRVRRGSALIAPGGKHMLLQRDSRGFYVQIKDGPPVNRHKPSVDVLFRSAANSAGRGAIGIILTGMGKDGAKGLCELRETGAYTIAQNEETCVVFGMPKAAIEMGGVDAVASIGQMPSLIARRERKTV